MDGQPHRRTAAVGEDTSFTLACLPRLAFATNLCHNYAYVFSPLAAPVTGPAHLLPIASVRYPLAYAALGHCPRVSRTKGPVPSSIAAAAAHRIRKVQGRSAPP